MNSQQSSLAHEIRLALRHQQHGCPGAPDVVSGMRVFRWVAMGLLLLALVACSTTKTAVPQRFTAPAVPSQCDAECTTSCLPADDAWPQWKGDPDDPRTWDLLPEQVIAPLRTIAETCDGHRKACVTCLERIDRVGLTCGTAVKCGSDP